MTDAAREPDGAVVEVLVRRLDPAAALPAYAHPGDAGADLVSTIEVTLGPGERRQVPTGVAIALPRGYAAFVHPRSGLADRFGLGIVNAPGTIDAGYRGEITVLLVNHDRTAPATLHRGDRIAQLVVMPVPTVQFHEVELLPTSARGEGGYGSTGGFTAPRAAGRAVSTTPPTSDEPPTSDPSTGDVPQVAGLERKDEHGVPTPQRP